MMWEVAFGDEFDGEFEALPQPVQDELLASAKLLGVFGPRWDGRTRTPCTTRRSRT